MQGPLPYQQETIDKIHGIVIASHVRRFETTYKRFFDLEQTQPLVNYFFRKIYALEGKKERDALALKTFERFKSMIKDSTRQRIEHLIHLNSITDHVDLQIVKYILQEPTLYEEIRQQRYIKDSQLRQLIAGANRKSDRIKQLKLTLFNFESFFDLSKQSRVEMLMKPARLIAKFMGVAKLFEVFEEGYQVSKPVSAVHFKNFIEFVKINEVMFLNDVFQTHITTDIFTEAL